MGNAACLDRFAPCGPREGHKFLAPMPRCRVGHPGPPHGYYSLGWWFLSCWDYPWLPAVDTIVSHWNVFDIFDILASCIMPHCQVSRTSWKYKIVQPYSNQHRKMKWDLWTEERKRSLLPVWPSRAKQALGRMAYTTTGVVGVWFRKFSRIMEELTYWLVVWNILYFPIYWK